ncbi:MAG: SDR family oxidoreductase [Nitrososphaeraceae archaeon]
MTSGEKGVALVTGSSTGIGFETSLAFAQNRYRTFATMRDLSKAEPLQNRVKSEHLPLKVVRMDVDECDSVTEAIKEIFEEEKRIDILVNNAGYGLFGALEDLSIEDIKRQFETNYFGAIRTIQQVLPIMRSQGSGNIVNISSMSGFIGFPASSVYVSSKFALEGLSESLSFEVAPYGINIILIEPGVINTRFVENLVLPANTQEISSTLLKELSSSLDTFSSPPPSTVTIAIHSSSYALKPNREKYERKEPTKYSDLVKRFLSHYYPSMSTAPDPKEVAQAILESIEMRRRRPFNRNHNLFRYPVGQDAKLYAEAKKKTSDSELHSLVTERTIL